jgi:hypothetical protein
MKLFTIFRLLSRGFSRTDPRFEEEAKRIEEEENRAMMTKQNALRDFKRVLHLKEAYAIARWLREEGRAVNLGELNEIEVWQRGPHFRLAVRKAEWEVYIIVPETTYYQLRSRIA